jgi:hypothetical protein
MTIDSNISRVSNAVMHYALLMKHYEVCLDTLWICIKGKYPETAKKSFKNIHAIFNNLLTQDEISDTLLLYKSQQDAHITEFILSDNCSTCFGRYYHSSSEAQTTVTTASGNH